jgi:hypothetical protein
MKVVLANFDEFADALKKFGDQLPEIIDVVVRKSAMDIVANTAREWPIDTGRSRAGWIASISDPPQSNYKGNAKTKGGTVQAAPFESVTEGTTVSVTVTNPVDYAPYLEYGTISVAPGGYLQRASRLARADIENLLQELVQTEWDGQR